MKTTARRNTEKMTANVSPKPMYFLEATFGPAAGLFRMKRNTIAPRMRPKLRASAPTLRTSPLGLSVLRTKRPLPPSQKSVTKPPVASHLLPRISPW